jgi:hypothetical protein
MPCRSFCTFTNNNIWIIIIIIIIIFIIIVVIIIVVVIIIIIIIIIVIIIIITYLVKKTGYVRLNVIIRSVRVTTVAVKTPSVCSLTYPARKAHEPYCHMWPIWLHHSLPYNLTHGKLFRKKLLTIKCVFWFSLQLLSETLLIVRRIQRYILINLRKSLCQANIFLVTLLKKICIFSTDFRKKNTTLQH